MKNLNTYLFFYKGEDEGWCFLVKARGPFDAYQKAFEALGPQVRNMICRFIKKEKESK